MDGTNRTLTLELPDLSQRKAGSTKVFPCVLSSETPVPRMVRGQHILEILSHAPGAVDLTRAPLPLLESHNAGALPVGIVDFIRLDSRKLRGEVRFSDSARGQELQADAEAGILRSLSVGYAINEFTETQATATKPLTITATKWAPYECSLIAVPADAGAGLNRSQYSADAGAEINYRTIQMTQEITHIENIQPVTPDPVLIERTRGLEVRRLGTLAQLPRDKIEELVSSGATVEAVRSVVIDAMAARDAARPIVTGGAGLERNHGALADDLIKRGGRGVLDIARQCVGGFSGSHDALIKRAMSTSDFPAILADASNKTLRHGYEAEPASHRAWVRAVPVKDFKVQNRPILGSAPALLSTVEGADYTYGSVSDDSATYTVAKYGRLLKLTFEALVNDDAGAFLRLLPAMGQAGRRLEADIVYSILSSNPVMQDSVVLFHATHANVTASGTFNAALLAAGRALLRKQTALGGGYLSLIPKTLIVAPDDEHDAELLLAAASRLTAGGVDAATPNWLTSLALVVEPRLDGSAAYLAASPEQIDSIELGLLEENFEGGPTLDSEDVFESDSKRYKVRHVCGAKALDWRGLVKMPIA